MLNEDVGADENNSAAQRDLSTFLSESAAAFAHTGDPTVSPERVFTSWPVAYPDQSKQALAKAQSEQMSVYIVEGPEKSGSANTRLNVEGAEKRQKALASEQLFERCNFFNSI